MIEILQFLHRTSISNLNYRELITKTIKNNLYNEDHIEIIIWLTAVFKFYDLFRFLATKIPSLSEQIEEFNQDIVIDSYGDDAKNYYSNINQCLRLKFEHISKYLIYFLIRCMVSYFLEFNDEEVINTAVHYSCINFLQ